MTQSIKSALTFWSFGKDFNRQKNNKNQKTKECAAHCKVVLFVEEY